MSAGLVDVDNTDILILCGDKESENNSQPKSDLS
jgi:hypothetical protein